MSTPSPTSPPQVGALDPDRETSPIVGEEELEEVEPDGHGGVCVYNDTVYPVGAFVRSGSEVLRCEAPGVWVREGELPPGHHVLD